MRLVYKLVMVIAGSLCSLIMLVVGEPTIAGVLAACVLLVVILLALAVVLVAGVLDVFGFVDMRHVRERRRIRAEIRRIQKEGGRG